MCAICLQTGLNMESPHSPFLYVLKAGLWGFLPEAPVPIRISNAEWSILLSQASAHAVEALFSDGAGLLPEGLKPSFRQLAPLAVAVDSIERGNEMVNAVLKPMAAFWKKSGIVAVLLKGQGLAGMYTNPEHRTPGDIDWYFPGKENFSKALSLIQSRGFAPEIDGDGDSHYNVKGVVVEHHKRWCDISNPFKRGTVSVIEKKYGYSQEPSFITLAPLTNLIQLNVHILKHVLVMGVGWRQLCDLALATKQYCGQYSKDEYEQAIGQLGLMRWTRLLYGVLAKYLGTDCAWMPVNPLESRDTDRLAALIMRCGNFGRGSGKKMMGSYLSASLLMFRFVPGEVLWRPLLLAGNRLGQLFRRK